MNTAVVSQLSFQDKVKSRIQDSIGDLMTDEDLQKLVDAAVHDAFFAKRYEKSGYNTIEKPPFLQDLVKTMLEPHVKLCIQEYLDTHHDEVSSLIKKTLEQDVATLFMRGFNGIFQNDLMMLGNNIHNRLNQLRV